MGVLSGSAAVFLVAIASSLLAVGSSICLNDSILVGGEEDGEYAPLLLVGKYKMNLDSINEQNQKLEALAHEQLRLQRELLQTCQNLTKRPTEIYRDCKDAYDQEIRVSGVYTIQPDEDQPFQVYCDMETDGGGWTVFQRRKDGSVDFYRDWVDYEQGFGNLTGELWLGLRKLHRLTSLSSEAAGNELRVDMEDFEENTAYAKYGSFAIGDSTAKYALSISGYSGTGGDSGSMHNGRRFTTRDNDNDIGSGGNCAHLCKGAWWYFYCHKSNLNGVYLRGKYQPGNNAYGVVWSTWKGYYYSLKFTEMKVRPQ